MGSPGGYPSATAGTPATETLSLSLDAEVDDRLKSSGARRGRRRARLPARDLGGRGRKRPTETPKFKLPVLRPYAARPRPEVRPRAAVGPRYRTSRAERSSRGAGSSGVSSAKQRIEGPSGRAPLPGRGRRGGGAPATADARL